MKYALFIALMHTGMLLSIPQSSLSQDKRTQPIGKKPESESAEKAAQAKAAKEAADQEIALSLMQVPAYIGLTVGQMRAQKAHDAAGFAQATQARNTRWALGYTSALTNPDTLTKLDRAYWTTEREYLHHIANLREYAESLEKYNDVYSNAELLQVRYALAVVEKLTTVPAEESTGNSAMSTDLNGEGRTKSFVKKSKEQEKLEKIAAILNS